MKKTRILALALVLCIAVLALASCSGTMSFRDVYSSELQALPLEVNRSEEFKLPDGCKYLHSMDDGIIVYTDEDTTANPPTGKLYVYSIDTGKVAFSIAAARADSVDIKTYASLNLLWTCGIGDDGEIKTTVYDYSGNKFAEAEGLVEIETDGNWFTFDYTVFYVDSVTEEIKNFGKYTDFDYPDALEYDSVIIGDYIVANVSTDEIRYYDLEFNYLSKYQLPTYVEDGRIYCLSGGNALIQYSVELDSLAEEYDFAEPGSEFRKFDLVTILFDPKSGGEKEIDFEYRIANITRRPEGKTSDSQYYAFSDRFTDKIENIGTVVPIENQRVCGYNDMEFVSVSNNGSVVGVFPKIDGETVIVAPLDGDLSLATPIFGLGGEKAYLLDKNFDIITAVDDIENFEYTGFGIVLGDKVYDKELNVILDTSEYDSVIARTDVSMLLLKTEAPQFVGGPDINKYYRFDKNGLTEIKAPDGKTASVIVNSYYEYYTVTYTDDAANVRRTVYALDGTLLFDTVGSFEVISEGNGCFLVRISELQGTTVIDKYYKISLTQIVEAESEGK